MAWPAGEGVAVIPPGEHRIEWSLGRRHVPGGRHERREVAIGDGVAVDGKRPDLDGAHRSLLRVEVDRAHAEGAARQADHAVSHGPGGSHTTRAR